MKFDSRLITVYVTAAGVMIAALILAHMYWKRRLTKWAASQHLELVSFRGAWFKAPPPGPAAATSTSSA